MKYVIRTDWMFAMDNIIHTAVQAAVTTLSPSKCPFGGQGQLQAVEETGNILCIQQLLLFLFPSWLLYFPAIK